MCAFIHLPVQDEAMNQHVPLGFFMNRHGPVAAPVKHSKDDSAAVQRLKTILPNMLKYKSSDRMDIQAVKDVVVDVERGKIFLFDTSLFYINLSFHNQIQQSKMQCLPNIYLCHV